jgi:hypothetical protein
MRVGDGVEYERIPFAARVSRANYSAFFGEADRLDGGAYAAAG